MRFIYRRTLAGRAIYTALFASLIGLCSSAIIAAQPLEPVPEPGPIPANGVVYSQGGCQGGDCGRASTRTSHWPCRQGHYYSPLSHAVHYPHGRMHSPDTGWGRPMKYPIDRMSVQYLRYWPQSWYGQSKAQGNIPKFPMVYMPTDTTQLGYYYQRVPQWRPNLAMIPPMPWPSQWHRRETSHTHYPPHWEKYTCQGCLSRHQPYEATSPATTYYSTPTPAGAAPQQDAAPATPGAPPAPGKSALEVNIYRALNR